MKEYPPRDEMLKPRDHLATIWVPAQSWHCLYCTKPEEGRYVEVTWIGPTVNGPPGRCPECGQKYALAYPGDRVPPPEEQHW